MNLRTGVPRPAWRLLDELVARIRPELVRYGDWESATRQLAGLRRYGNGAARQRRIKHRTGEIPAVIAYLAAETEGHS